MCRRSLLLLTLWLLNLCYSYGCQKYQYQYIQYHVFKTIRYLHRLEHYKKWVYFKKKKEKQILFCVLKSFWFFCPGIETGIDYHFLQVFYRSLRF